MNRISSPDVRHRARDEVRRVHDTFSPEQLKAGVQILSTVSRQVRFPEKEALFFSKEGLYAWSTMYLLAKIGVESPASPI